MYIFLLKKNFNKFLKQNLDQNFLLGNATLLSIFCKDVGFPRKNVWSKRFKFFYLQNQLIIQRKRWVSNDRKLLPKGLMHDFGQNEIPTKLSIFKKRTLSFSCYFRDFSLPSYGRKPKKKRIKINFSFFVFVIYK